jgi:hypothetical protein
MKKTWRSVHGAVLVLGMMLSGCVGPLQQWGAQTSPMLKAPSFESSMLESEPSAVLNAVVGFGLEGYTNQVSRSLFTALEKAPPALKVISPLDTLSQINRKGLEAEYAAMVSQYQQSGILDRMVLEKVGQALNARYVFQPSMATFTQSMSGRFSIFGLRLIQTRISTLRLSVQIWDTRSGEIVWESTGEATLAGEDVREYRIPFEEIASRLWQQMFQNLWPGE